VEPTFGIEEEFVLLDPHTLIAVDRAPEAIAALSGARGAVGKEFFPSQIEFASPVFTSVTEALDAVREFRRSLAAWAEAAGLVAAGTGTPFRTGPGSEISPDVRYAHIADDIAGVTPDHQINGLHVHVGIPDAESGVRASNTLRVWLPTLLALSSNSPYWHGEDTGFDSWRAIHSRRWTTYGAPPFFRDAAEHDAARWALRGIGATSDPGTINWNVRLSARYPTVEVRVFDAQLDPRSSVALAAITRALVASADLPTVPAARDQPSEAMDLTDAALWHAARFGLGGTLVHPFSGRVLPARDVLHAFDDRIRPHLADPAERDLVDELLRRAIRDGSGAARQRRARTSGLGGLARLYRQELADAGNVTGLSA
jgi:carboxylate-amine ligase